MSDNKLRREIALRAAQLMYARDVREYYTAKRKAAEQVCRSGRLRDLPSNAEIREQILLLSSLVEGDERARELTAMRLEALRFLRLLHRYRPRLIGSVLTGHIRSGSDIDLHVFTDTPSSVSLLLDEAGYEHRVEHKRVQKHHVQRVFTHIHVSAAFPVELTVYTADKANYPFKSSITGKTIERASAEELEALIQQTAPDLDIEAELAREEDDQNVWALYDMLLRPLEQVKQNPKWHPEGDALYHSLQVFQLARHVKEYDQEFLLAALLHDVGKAIDPHDHVAAGVDALRGSVTDRTLWLIEHHMEAHACRDGSIGARARRRLAESEDFEDLLLLSELDHAGRRPGVVVMTIDEALDILMRMEDDM